MIMPTLFLTSKTWGDPQWARGFDYMLFPSPLKVSKILPIHKGDSVFEMSNYRPISLLPIFSKILEKLMYSRVISFIKRYKILYRCLYPK